MRTEIPDLLRCPRGRRPGAGITRIHAGRLSRRQREILALLVAGGEMTGLDLIAASSCLGRGMVYVALLRLADKGLVDSRPAPERRRNGHRGTANRGAELPRRLFRATAAAPAVLAAAEGPARRGTAGRGPAHRETRS